MVAHIVPMQPKKARRPEKPSPASPATSALSRRDLLKGALGLGAVAALSGCATGNKTAAGGSARSGAQPDWVRRENAKSGTRDWLLQKTGIDPKTKYRCPWIEGYCSKTSVRAGETIDFHVSTNPPSRFTLDLYRMGCYGGAGGRHMRHLGPFQGIAQTD